MIVQHHANASARGIVLVGQAEKFHKFAAAMPVPYQTQHFPAQQIDAGQQRQGTVTLVFVIPSLAPLATADGGTPPLTLAIMIKASDLLRGNATLLLTAAGASAVAAIIAYRFGALQRLVDQLLMDGPFGRTNGALVFGGFAVALGLLTTSAPTVAKDKYACFTDDGYGRKRPCSAGYKAANPNWRAGSDCFTDEGYGRYRPCDSFVKSPSRN